MDIEELEKILALLKDNNVTEFELHQDGTQIRLTRGQMVTHQTTSASTVVELEPAIVNSPNGPSAPIIADAAGAEEEDLSFTKVESPIVGTYYCKPAPDAAAFVESGDRVKKGDTLCIVEAMKLMNEIESPCDGIIKKILLSDGQVVEFGETLFLIDPTG